MKKKRLLGAALLFTASIVVVIDRRLAAELPTRPLWREELHPLLGAAPTDSFARALETEPWRDFRGRAFSRRRPPAGRALLLGGGRAVGAVSTIEERLGAVELVVAAREGASAVQAALLVGRFGPALDVSQVIALNGEELQATGPAGWTPEWDWHAAALASPLGEALARHSGLARAFFLRPAVEATTTETRRRRYLLDVRAMAALARARGLPLLWAFTGDASERALAAEAAALVRARGGRAFDDPDALVRALGSP